MRKIRRKKENTKRKIIILGVFLCLVIMASGYAAFSTNINLKVKGNIKYNSRVIQAWDTTSQTDFHSDFYRENIVSATFVDNNNVPDNAVESWNVSDDKTNGEVMAWVVPNISDSSKYDLYIGAKAGVIANENSSHLFDGFSNMKAITFNDNFDTSNVSDMRGMFRRESNLTNLDLSSFDTSNVTNMGGMFSDNFALETVNLSSFDTSNVTTMAWMFSQCNKLNNLDLSTFNTSNVTNMEYMFLNCHMLTILDLSNFDTSSVTNMNQVFTNCTALKYLNVSNFNTSKVTNMQKMFNNCEELTSLDLSSFDTRNVTDMSLMFSGDNKLTVIYVGQNWVTDKANTTLMFNACGTSQVTQK